MISDYNDRNHYQVIILELLSYRISLDYWIYAELDLYPLPLVIYSLLFYTIPGNKNLNGASQEKINQGTEAGLIKNLFL